MLGLSQTFKHFMTLEAEMCFFSGLKLTASKIIHSVCRTPKWFLGCEKVDHQQPGFSFQSSPICTFCTITTYNSPLFYTQCTHVHTVPVVLFTLPSFSASNNNNNTFYFLTHFPFGAKPQSAHKKEASEKETSFISLPFD